MGNCDVCESCHYCHDGIDGTCGTCGADFPTNEKGSCKDNEGICFYLSYIDVYIKFIVLLPISTFTSILFALQLHPTYQDQKEHPLTQEQLPKEPALEIDLKQLLLPQPRLQQ